MRRREEEEDDVYLFNDDDGLRMRGMSGKFPGPGERAIKNTGRCLVILLIGRNGIMNGRHGGHSDNDFMTTIILFYGVGTTIGFKVAGTSVCEF